MIRTDDPYKDLALAIVKQAADDYREALKNLKRKPTNKTYQSEVDELESFFNSDWCYDLAGMDCSFIARKIKSEVRDESKRISKPSVCDGQKDKCEIRSAYEAKRYRGKDNLNN